jgi:hypothetical protein
MVVRFFHADRDVTAALDRAVRSMPRPLLITQLQGPRTLAVESRTPFKEILDCAGGGLDLVVVIDEGRPEGMWRDPVGELCDRLFAGSKESAAAAAGYVVTHEGRALGWFRKALWDPLEDAEAITSFLAGTVPGMRPYVREKPKPAHPRPRPRRTRTPIVGTPSAGQYARTQEMPAVEVDDEPTPVTPPPRRAESEAQPPEPPPEPPPIDPFKILGVAPGVTLEEAKKAWRGLIVQYHPDKVAHLAPEFRALAEEKTRELNAAWELLEKKLRG